MQQMANRTSRGSHREQEGAGASGLTLAGGKPLSTEPLEEIEKKQEPPNFLSTEPNSQPATSSEQSLVTFTPDE